MSNQHEKSEPKPEEETNPCPSIRGAKGERHQEIHRLKKQLEQDLQKKIMEYIEVLGISKSVADAARLGKTSVKIDIRGAQNHFQRYYNTTDVFNFVENKSMELRFEKKWTEFFHEFKKTIAVDDLKESTLVQEAVSRDDILKTIETDWPLPRRGFFAPRTEMTLLVPEYGNHTIIPVEKILVALIVGVPRVTFVINLSTSTLIGLL